MRKRPRLEKFRDTAAPRSRINRGQTLRQGDCRAGPPKGERSGAFEQWFDRSAELRPELDLTSNRAFCDLCGQASIENEFVGYLDGLAHNVMVAFCYPMNKPSTRSSLRSGKSN